jgi:transposase
MNAGHEPLPDDVDALKALVLASRAEVEHLKLIIEKLKRLQFGRRSEKIEREIEQLELRLEELQVTAVPTSGASSEKPAAHAPVRRPLGRLCARSARTWPRCSNTCRRVSA